MHSWKRRLQVRLHAIHGGYTRKPNGALQLPHLLDARGRDDEQGVSVSVHSITFQSRQTNSNFPDWGIFDTRSFLGNPVVHMPAIEEDEPHKSVSVDGYRTLSRHVGIHARTQY